MNRGARAPSRVARFASAAACAAALCAPAVAAGRDEGWIPEELRGPAAWAVEVDGRLLASHAATAPRQPASLAKLAAAIVTIEAADAGGARLDAVVTVGAEAARADGTRAGLRAGERFTAQRLLEAMLVGSANDACLALAAHVAGDASAMVARMNALAERLGMAATRFADPCGFDRPRQRTTAQDLLRLARAAIAEPRIARIVEAPGARIEEAGGARALAVRATNALLLRYEGAIGLKTGHTREAGPCLIAVARRGSTTATVVVLGARDRWPVSVALLDEAFGRTGGFPRAGSRPAVGDPDS